jgi:hypothetical protein
MSLLQGVLRSHTTDTLDKRLSNPTISQRTQPNPDKDDSDDELVNVVRLALILPLSLCHIVYASRYQYPGRQLARSRHRGHSRPHAERLLDRHQDPSISADRASHPAILSKSSRPIYHRKYSIG